MDINSVFQARERISADVLRTPLIKAPRNEAFPEVELYLKCENFQLTRSFKPRGAFNLLRGLDCARRALPVVTRSSGNFAQAVAYASSKLGIKATIVMPQGAPSVKVERTKSFGATVEFCGTTSFEGDKRAKEISEATGSVLLSPYDHELVIAGQGTAAIEVSEELSRLDYFFAPIGGGGLMGGCSLVVKELFPTCVVVAAEPAGADDFAQSLESGQRVTLDKVETIADGLRTLSVGETNWPVLRSCVSRVDRVSDDSIVAAMRWLYTEMGIVVEPSGAASLAALLAAAPSFGRAVCVCLLSGGNVDLHDFQTYMKRST